METGSSRQSFTDSTPRWLGLGFACVLPRRVKPHVNGGTYGSGASASLTPGNYTVTFDTVSGWTAPASQPVTMKPAQSIVIPGNYTPPAGQPAIYGISPPIGPNSGGTLLTINGVNFTTPTTILVGGQPASNISVSSATQITCSTPASPTNGSVSIVVQATGGNATNQNGFAYGVARGNKLDLISSFGGTCYGVAVQGNYAYVGEGRNLLVLDVTTPSNPSRVGKVTLPGVIQDIAIFSHYACVADGEGGFQIVDITTASTPTIAGYYATTNYTWSSVLGIKDFTDLSYGIGTTVAINGTKAIVGLPNNSALRVLDISNISSPQQVGILTNVPSTVTITSPDGSCLYVVNGSNPATLTVVSITNLTSPSVVTNILIDPSSFTYYGLDVRGNELFVSTWTGVYVYDISTPSSPVKTRSYSGASGIVSLCAPSDSVNQNNIVYAADSNGGIAAFREQDIQAPNVYITDPVFGNFWTSSTSTLNLGGGSDDNVSVTAIAWANDRGGSGQVSPPLDSWYVSGIKLYPGTNNITATAFDAAGNSGIDVLTVVYPTTNQNQTIIFPPIASHTFGDAFITLDAAASSGLPVTFSVVSGPATLSSSNVLNLTGAGTVTVQANQPGNSSYNPAPSTNVSFTVTLANQAITFAPIPAKAPTDAPFALTATTSSGLPVYFSVLSGPAGINSSNYVTLLGAGTVSILAWQPGNSNYNAAATVQQSFTVSQIPQTIAFGALSQQRSVDAPFPIYASASSGLPVSLSVLSGPAQLSGNVLKLTGAGTVTVRASQAGSSVFAPAANVDQSLTVLPPSNTVGSPQYNVSGFNLTFYGTVGSNYLFQASSNLVNWTTLQTFSCTNIIMNFQDTSATGMAHRFYQIKPQ